MMKSITGMMVLAALSAVSFVGCSGSGAGNGVGNNGGIGLMGGGGGNGGGGNDGINGTWGSDALNSVQNGVQVTILIKIEANQITESMTCGFNDGAVVSEATAPITVTGTQLTINEAKTNTVKNHAGDMECTASLSAQAYNYKLEGNQLTMTKANAAGAAPTVLTRQ